MLLVFAIAALLGAVLAWGRLKVLALVPIVMLLAAALGVQVGYLATGLIITWRRPWP